MPSPKALLLLVATSCASAPAPAPARRVTPVEQGCVVRGERVKLEGVIVHPPGEPRFRLGLTDVPVNALLPGDGRSALTLEVDGAITFRATRKNVRFTVTAASESPDGMVTLGRGTALVDVRSEHGQVVGAAVLYSNDVLEGEDKPPDETFAPVRVPCGGVVLGSGFLEVDEDDADDDRHGEDEDEDEDEAEDSWWRPRGKDVRAVHLYARPDVAAPAAALAAPSCIDCLELHGIRDEGAWILVERTGEGVTARGWIERRKLDRVPDGEGGMGRSYGCLGDHSSGRNWGEGWSGGKPAGLYEGPAVVRAGTRVFAAPERGEWALIRSELAVTVRHLRGESWVELRAIPGITGDPEGTPWLNAHVAVEDVEFPAGAVVGIR